MRANHRSYAYDGKGTLLSVGIDDGRNRTVSFANDLNGQALRRDEADALTGGDPHEMWFRYGGREMGYAGNNGRTDVHMAASTAQRTAPTQSTTGAFRNGATTHSSEYDFDTSLAKLNSTHQGSQYGVYTVRGGETLQSIAANLWGDASLWFKLAEANGLTGASALASGQTLTIPAGVTKNTHNADTFRPYDAAEAIGDTSPTAPKPGSKNKCGVFGAVLLVAVAVAVAVVTSGAALAASGAVANLSAGIGTVLGAAGATSVGAGALIGAGVVGGAVGSIVSQGLGVATGLQDKFSWKGVALAGLSGGVGAGVGSAIGLSGVAGGVVRGAVGSALTQGIAVATGLQNKFSWAGVAASAVGSGVGAEVGGAFGKAGSKLAGIGQRLAASAADAIANAASNSVLTGTSFGDNVLAALPSVLGNTIGNALAGAVAGQGKMSPLEKLLVADAEASANRVPAAQANASYVGQNTGVPQNAVYYPDDTNLIQLSGFQRKASPFSQIGEEVFRNLENGRQGFNHQAYLKYLDSTVGTPLFFAEQVLSSGTVDNPGPGRLISEFRLGDVGPSRRLLGPESTFSKGFADALSTRGVVTKALREWRTRDGGMLAQNGTFTNGRASFGPVEFGAATVDFSPEAHVIGSFNYRARIVNDNRILWTATNELSVKSFFADGWTKSAGISIFQNQARPVRYGNTIQVIQWITDFRGTRVK